MPSVTEELIDAALPEGDGRDRIKALGLTSAMTVPLTARGRTLGALTLVSGDPRRHFDVDDLRFAEDLGARAGVAIDNVLLYERSRHIATTLQQSLLPIALPTIAGLDVTARYNAAGEGIDVGGDFYDLFELPDGAGWAAVLGDVCGKGPDAASLTALARYTIRAEADALSPSAVLGRLNDAVLRQRGDGRFLTVTYVWLTPTPGGLNASSGSWRPHADPDPAGGGRRRDPCAPRIAGRNHRRRRLRGGRGRAVGRRHAGALQRRGHRDPFGGA